MANGLYEAAGEIHGFMESQGWRFCVIGGLAVIRWGQPRATQDVDITLFTDFGSEEAYLDTLLEQFTGRLSDARQFALENRVLLISASNHVPLDITLAAFPYEDMVIERASRYQFAATTSLVTASAEDLLVMKALAGRDRDWSDIESIVIRQQDTLDWDYILSQLQPLAELSDQADAVSQLLQWRRDP